MIVDKPYRVKPSIEITEITVHEYYEYVYN